MWINIGKIINSGRKRQSTEDIIKNLMAIRREEEFIPEPIKKEEPKKKSRKPTRKEIEEYLIKNIGNGEYD